MAEDLPGLIKDMQRRIELLEQHKRGGGGGDAGSAGTSNGNYGGSGGGNAYYSDITGSSRPYASGGSGTPNVNDGNRDHRGATPESDYGGGAAPLVDSSSSHLRSPQPGVVILRFITTFIIVTSAGIGGSITETSQVDKGSTKAIAITPNPGYYIVSKTVNSITTTLNSNTATTHIFNNITSNQTISAAFAVKPKVETTTTENGAITPSNPTVDYNSVQTFTITAAPGNIITQILIDGVQQTITNRLSQTVTLSGITTDRAVYVTFKVTGGNIYHNFL